MSILGLTRLKFAPFLFSGIALAACGVAAPAPRPTPPIAATPDYQSTQAVVNALANLQSQAKATEAAATQGAIAINNTARELSMQETQVANDTLRLQLEYSRTIATLDAQHATATQAAGRETQAAFYLPTQMAATQEAQEHERGRGDVAFGAGLLGGLVLLFGFVFAVIDRLAAHNRAIVAQAMAESTKVVQVGQVVMVVAGGQVVETIEAQPGAQVVEHGPQLAPPQRDPRTARALQFLEVAIACPKPDGSRWPANRLPTHTMLKDAHARDFYSGSSWQDAVNLFGALVQATPGKGAFVTAPTLEDFYQQLAAGKVALPQ